MLDIGREDREEEQRAEGRDDDEGGRRVECREGDEVEADKLFKMPRKDCDGGKKCDGNKKCDDA